jgi:hypothetical protein
MTTVLMSRQAASNSERQPRPASTLNHVSAGDWRQAQKCIPVDDEKRHRRPDFAGIRDAVLRRVKLIDLVEAMPEGEREPKLRRRGASGCQNDGANDHCERNGRNEQVFAYLQAAGSQVMADVRVHNAAQRKGGAPKGAMVSGERLRTQAKDKKGANTPPLLTPAPCLS